MHIHTYMHLPQVRITFSCLNGVESECEGVEGVNANSIAHPNILDNNCQEALQITDDDGAMVHHNTGQSDILTHALTHSLSHTYTHARMHM